MKIEISLFRFDKDFDYLPYYTKHFLILKGEKTLLDIFNTLEKEQNFSYLKDENFSIVINGLYSKLSLSVETLLRDFGKELTFDPICIKRVSKDFIINDDDFNSRLKILKNFINEEDKKNYKELKIYYYASNTLNYEKEYIGDSILILVYDLIKANQKNKQALLKILNEQKIGASFHTNLEHRVYNFDKSVEDKILFIQEELGLIENIKLPYKLNFGEFEKEYKIKYFFEDFNIAYFKSKQEEETKIFLSKLKANFLTLASLKHDLAKNTFNKNPKITYQVASSILLDAFDNNADFVLVDNEEDFHILDYNRQYFLKYSGREVLIPIVHKNELQNLACGNFEKAKKTLDLHKINPEII